MTLPIRFRPEVHDEVRDAFTWYQLQRQGLGWELSLCIEEALARLRENPEAFPVAHRGIRRAPVRRFPFGVYFTIRADHIMVIAVYHSSRDPRVWQEREDD